MAGRNLRPRYEPKMPGFDQLDQPGDTTARFHGMDRASTVTEQPVDSDTQPGSSESPTEHYIVELSLSSVTEDGSLELVSSIVVHTSEDATGIFQGVSAQLLRTASLARSTGGSHRD